MKPRCAKSRRGKREGGSAGRECKRRVGRADGAAGEGDGSSLPRHHPRVGRRTRTARSLQDVPRKRAQ
eukprot:622777-Hanusia_phi.AAC.1